jgi:cytosine deaminase
MTLPGQRLPPLRIPRSLLDPTLPGLVGGELDGLVAVEIHHRQGTIAELRPLSLQEQAAAGPLPLALPSLLDPHVHLDKAFTAPRFPNREGTVAGAMAANLREHLERDEEAVHARAERALQLAWCHGMRALRSHIDSLGPGAAASWDALESLRRDWASRLELQLVALVPVHHWLTPEGERLAARVAAVGGQLGGVIGPPFSQSLPGAGGGASEAEALLAMMGLAEHHGCGVDLHIDESDQQPGRGVDLVSRLRLRHRLTGPLTCSHASSMGLLPAGACDRLADRIAAAGIGVVALPTTNLWLLGKRRRRTPCLRPQAPIRQLQAAGVCVALGGDNVQDPWFPGGAFDPIALLRQLPVLSQLVPWQRLGLAPMTTAAAQLMGLAWDGVLRIGAPADLVVLGVSSWHELLAVAPRRRVLRGGVWLPPPPTEEPSALLAFADSCRHPLP